MLFDLITALLPVKTIVEALCGRDSNLFTADIAINFTLKELKDAKSNISKKLYAALILRMEERRTDLNGLLQYLHNGVSNDSGIDFITVPSSIKCLKLVEDLLERLDASDRTALLTAHSTGSSITNEVTLEIDSDSITESNCTQIP